MPSKFAVFLSEDGLKNIDGVILKRVLINNKFILCKNVNPDIHYFFMEALITNGKKNCLSLFVPHRYISCYLLATPKSSLGLDLGFHNSPLK
jgi:hypothetical protein